MAHTDAHGVHHETTDVNVAGVTRLLLIVVALLVVSFLLMLWMFYSFKALGVAGDVKPSALAQRTGDRLPPLPRLQTVPVVDLKAFRAGEMQVLETYAWVDQANGVVRMPIAEAIAHAAANGLPKAVALPSAQPAAGSAVGRAPGAPVAGPSAGQAPHEAVPK
jgi:hypothetical protein